MSRSCVTFPDFMLNCILGRASATPSIDVFITLLQMGTKGYKKLTDERKENFKILKEEMSKIADKYGERVLDVKNNPISIGKLLGDTFD